jgi:hypothetical protein
MKSLLFDELRVDEIKKIEDYLYNKTIKGSIEGLYWLPISEELLTNEQKQLLNKFESFKIAIEVGKTWLKFELFLRSSSKDNIGGCIINSTQFNFIYEFADTLAKSLNLITCI